VAKSVFDSLGDLANSTNLTDSSAGGIGDVVGSQIPPIMNITVMIDFTKRLNETISFDTAVNGNPGFLSLTGVKEWVQKQNDAITKFYNSTQQ
jgi:hypothetical protein